MQILKILDVCIDLVDAFHRRTIFGACVMWSHEIRAEQVTSNCSKVLHSIWMWLRWGVFPLQKVGQGWYASFINALFSDTMLNRRKQKKR